MAQPPTDLPRAQGERPSCSGVGPRAGADDGSPSARVARQIERMTVAWRGGERPRSEEFLAQLPDLRDADAVQVIYEEACLRLDEGEDLETLSSELLGRFPRWRSKLALLLDCHQLMHTPREAEFPDAGDEFGDFELLAEIGRGAHGRTFLASQRSLAHRPLVLKITPAGHDEHLSLARLQHMHIVPLYFEQVLPERNIRVLGMPYLGGTTLDRILDAMDAVPMPDRTGRHILEVLNRCDAARAIATEYPTNGPFLRYLAQASYAQAMCWVGACLAEALQYAHDRGLVHMDVKASNVLIASDGQPMLLDFHLARGPVGTGLSATDRLGGTPGCMSPEQHEAMAAIRKGEAVAVMVDGRSDVYSLGLLLYEALGGNLATDSAAARRPLESRNPRISPGLSDIVQKCLAHDPAGRYSRASLLAQDLMRHLNNQPLYGVANRSPVERWRKWRRRQPATLGKVLFSLAALAALLGALSVLIVQDRRVSRGMEVALNEGRAHLRSQRYAQAVLALDRGLALAGPLLDRDPRTRALHATLRAVHREQAAAEIHDLVNLFRFQFGLTPPSDDEARDLFQRGRAIWERRRLLAQPAGGGATGPATESQVRAELLDLATILAELRMQGGSRGSSDEARGDAVRILLEAREQFGPSLALSRDLRAYASPLAGPAPDVSARDEEASVPRTAWEHYDLGRSYFRSSDYALAAEEFRCSVTLQPGEFWPHFFQGVCAFRLGRPRDSVAELSICVALAPGSAACYYNRAKACEALGQTELAQADYTRTLELDPAFTDAALNRGVLAFRAGRYAEAVADFKRARATATAPRSLGLICYNLALVHVAQRNLPEARACLEEAIAHGDNAARELYASLGR